MPPGPDPLGWCVDPEDFRRHVETLAALEIVRPLPDLVDDVLTGRTPHGVAITLDLGFADHLRYALPVLRELGVPATMFLVTGLPGQVPWWESMAADLARIQEEVEVLELSIHGHPVRFAFDDREARKETTLHLRQDLAGLLPRQRDPVLAELRSLAGDPEPSGGRFLTDAEVGQLAFQANLDLGAATVTHPCLARAPVTLQEQEIQDSARHIQERLQRDVDLFAYPFGLKYDFDYRSRHLVHESGLRAAFTSQGGLVERHADALALPRHAVWTGGVEETATRALEMFR